MFDLYFRSGLKHEFEGRQTLMVMIPHLVHNTLDVFFLIACTTRPCLLSPRSLGFVPDRLLSEDLSWIAWTKRMGRQGWIGVVRCRSYKVDQTVWGYSEPTSVVRYRSRLPSHSVDQHAMREEPRIAARQGISTLLMTWTDLFPPKPTVIPDTPSPICDETNEWSFG